MYKKFDPISGKCGEIVEEIMQSPDVSSLDDSIQFKIRLCAEEAIENIVDYAYERGDGFIEVNSKVEGDLYKLSLKDGGIPFNPLEKSDPDINVALEERAIGGLGIFLCKQMTDEIRYEYKDGCNILSMSIKK